MQAGINGRKCVGIFGKVGSLRGEPIKVVPQVMACPYFRTGFFCGQILCTCRRFQLEHALPRAVKQEKQKGIKNGKIKNEHNDKHENNDKRSA